VRHVYRLFAAMVGAILGLAGCENNAPEEYGVPQADFRLSGRTVRASDGTAVPGIEVSFGAFAATADTSDAQGGWSIACKKFPCNYFHADSCLVTARDIDGALYEALRDTTVTLDLVQTRPGDGRWYEGRFEQHDLDIPLTTAARSDGE